MPANPLAPSPLSLVAPELAPALEYFPDLDFSQGMAAFRGPFDARMLPPLPPELEAVQVEERFVPSLTDAPEVRVLVYTPPAAMPARPALLHVHGGGFVLGTPEINDASNRTTALALGITVVSVDYRLAPETTWPGALEDCYAALAWMHDNAAEIGIDRARIAVAGESAGGGHAVALALRVRDRLRAEASGPSLCFALLDAPMIDDRTGSLDDPHPHTGHFVWTPDKNRFGWSAMLGRAAGGPDVPAEAVPARATDLSDLPPMFVTVGSLDLFLEEDMDFVRRLTRARVTAELHVIPGAYHGFGIAQGSPQVAQAEALRQTALTRALGIGK